AAGDPRPRAGDRRQLADDAFGKRLRDRASAVSPGGVGIGRTTTDGARVEVAPGAGRRLASRVPSATRPIAAATTATATTAAAERRRFAGGAGLEAGIGVATESVAGSPRVPGRTSAMKR